MICLQGILNIDRMDTCGFMCILYGINRMVCLDLIPIYLSNPDVSH